MSRPLWNGVGLLVSSNLVPYFRRIFGVYAVRVFLIKMPHKLTCLAVNVAAAQKHNVMSCFSLLIHSLTEDALTIWFLQTWRMLTHIYCHCLVIRIHAFLVYLMGMEVSQIVYFHIFLHFYNCFHDASVSWKTSRYLYTAHVYCNAVKTPHQHS